MQFDTAITAQLQYTSAFVTWESHVLLPLQRRPFHLLPLPKMDLLLTDNRGWGVRAAEPIPKGAFIVEYAGEVRANMTTSSALPRPP